LTCYTAAARSVSRRVLVLSRDARGAHSAVGARRAGDTHTGRDIGAAGHRRRAGAARRTRGRTHGVPVRVLSAILNTRPAVGPGVAGVASARGRGIAS